MGVQEVQAQYNICSEGIYFNGFTAKYISISCTCTGAVPWIVNGEPSTSTSFKVVLWEASSDLGPGIPVK